MRCIPGVWREILRVAWLVGCLGGEDEEEEEDGYCCLLLGLALFAL